MKEFPGKVGWQLVPLLFLAALLTCSVILSAVHKEFNVDELEHVHSAWYIVQGFVPFRDFFQHHNPLLWYIIAPAIAVLGDNARLLVYFRVIMAGMAICTAVLASAVAVMVSSRRVAGLYCFIILLSSLIFIERAVEIRPDVPMILFEAISAYFLVRYLDTGKSREIVLCGLLASVAFLFLQKAVFFYAVLLIVMMLYVLKRKVKVKSLMYLLVSLSAGPALCIAYAALNGALYDYFLCGYLVNVAKPKSFGLWEVFKKNLYLNAGFWGVTLIGLLYGLFTSGDNMKRGVISLFGLALFLGLFSIKKPYSHNFLPALVFLSMAGAVLLARLSEKGRMVALLCVFIVAVMVYKPLMFSVSYNAKSRNRSQMDRIEWVIRNTGRDDLVYDGENRFNLFRRDLHYFWFSTALGSNLNVYNRMNNDRFGDYDICELIKRKKPRIASDFQVDAKECAAFKDYSRVDDVGLYMLNGMP